MAERVKVGSVTAKDCHWEYFRAGGKGGQHQNKTDSAVRVTHPPSGAVGESRNERSQLANRRIAWRRMAESDKFQAWVRREAGMDAAKEAELARQIEAAVDRAMRPENLLIEVYKDGAWVSEEDGQES